MEQQANIFYLNPKNANFISGGQSALVSHDKYLSITCCFFPFIFIPLLIFIAFAGILSGGMIQQYALDRHGVQGQATVIEKYIAHDTKGKPNYNIRYRFVAQNDQPYEESNRVDQQFYDATQPSQSITIEYEIDNPSNSRISGQGMGWQSLAAMTLGIYFFGGLFILGQLKNWGSSMHHLQKLQNLASNGSLITGEVIQAEGKVRFGKYFIRVHYRFVTPDTGEIIEDVHMAQLNDHKESDPLPPFGSPVQILYTDPQTYRVL